MKQAILRTLKRVLPPRLAKAVFHVGFHVARDEFDLFAHEYALAPSMDRNLVRLVGRGLTARTVVDVGAYHGDWSRMARTLWPEAELHMVEANAQKEARLKDVAREIDATLHMALLGPEDGEEVTFYVMESGSSVMEENSPLDRTEVTTVTRRLDDVIGERSVDVLKIDVQGFELEVMRGAPRILDQVGAVLLEVALIQINKGAPLFAEVVGFMAERGFEVADVVELHRRPLDGATNQVDLVFVPTGSPLLADTRHFA